MEIATKSDSGRRAESHLINRCGSGVINPSQTRCIPKANENKTLLRSRQQRSILLDRPPQAGACPVNLLNMDIALGFAERDQTVVLDACDENYVQKNNQFEVVHIALVYRG